MCFFITSIILAQEKTITGVVSDSSGELPGVSILIKGTTKGTETDFNGNYTIKANKGDVLVYSFIGLKTVEKTVSDATVINVTMIADNLLEEVVVIGYGKQDKNKLVQSIASVSEKDIEDIPAASPQDLLQGQASGVQIVNSSGILGSSPVIKIRGVASISSGGRPLVVIDGVPLNDAVLTGGQGGQGLNPLADINPNDIANFSVLKDAAATAIYGSRGANGVILITTKTGKKNQKTKVTINTSTSFSKATDLIDMMSADEFRQFLVDTNAGISDINALPQGSFNWANNVVQTGFSKNINVGITGGNEKTSFYIGGTYRDQEGFIIGNSLTSSSARLNLNHDVNDWLKVGVNLNISNSENDRVGSENSTAAPLTSAYLQRPWILPRDEDGNYVNTGFIQNVIAIEDLDINDLTTNRIVGNAKADIKLTNDLTFTSDFGIDRLEQRAFSRSFEVNTPGGSASSSINKQEKFVFTNTLNFNRTFADVHSVNATGGISYEETDLRTFDMAATGFLSDDQINLASASEPTVTTNDVSESRLVGYFLRTNYSYDNKYVLEASIRQDGSSRFGSNFRFGTFWAVGAAWNVSNENFFNPDGFLNSLKIKANFGTSGNDRIGNYASLESFEGGNISNYDGSSGLRFLSAANPDLTWERSESFNVGFETSFLNDRVQLNVDYYKKKTTDLILNVPIPVTNSGINSVIRNVGSMQNSGFDIQLNTTNIKTDNFEWTTSLNLGFNKNEVLSLPGAGVDNEGRQFVDGSANQRAIVGHSVNTFYLIRYKGVNPQTGDAEWLDRDGNVTLNPTENDRVIVGDANPDFTGGLRTTFKYKNFDLNGLFNFSYGNDIFVGGLRFTDNAATTSFNKSRRLLDYWQQPGDNSFAPSPTSATFRTWNQRSTLQLKDGSFLRLKNVTLGYTLPKKIIEKIGFLDNVRIYTTANNLWTLKADDLEGIDPEVTDSIGNQRQGETFFTPPQFKTYLFGVRVSF